jgi:hypothetical protein
LQAVTDSPAKVIDSLLERVELLLYQQQTLVGLLLLVAVSQQDDEQHNSSQSEYEQSNEQSDDDRLHPPEAIKCVAVAQWLVSWFPLPIGKNFD